MKQSISINLAAYKRSRCSHLVGLDDSDNTVRVDSDGVSANSVGGSGDEVGLSMRGEERLAEMGSQELVSTIDEIAV